MSTAEYMREYRSREPYRRGRPCATEACSGFTHSKSGYCRPCAEERKQIAREHNLHLVPGACRDCGIRPAPEYDMPGTYILVIVDELCDDCRLRRRRTDHHPHGSVEWHRAHTPMGPIGRMWHPLVESGKPAHSLTIYGSSGRDAY